MGESIMLIVTTDTIPGKDIKEVLGLVSDSTVNVNAF